MRIAIIGGGFAGLATCYQLLANSSSVSKTLFEKNAIGSGASGVSAGLMHPYTGTLTSYERYNQEQIAIHSSIKLLDKVAEIIGKTTYVNSGVVRCALSRKDEIVFSDITQSYPNVVLWNAHYTESQIGIAKPAIYISQGISVYTEIYLQGLWAVCQSYGVKLVLKTFLPKDNVDFDIVVWACGADLPQVYPELTLRLKRGEVLVCQKKIKYGIIGDGYLNLSADPNICYVGSTSRSNLSTIPFKEASALILKKIAP